MERERRPSRGKITRGANEGHRGIQPSPARTVASKSLVDVRAENFGRHAAKQLSISKSRSLVRPERTLAVA
jgi:hypothetical protein